MRRSFLTGLMAALLPTVLTAVGGQAQERVNAPYVPTPEKVVERMMGLAQPRPMDVIYDLGSGDGRIPITAVKVHNLHKAVGIDINPVRIAESLANARAAGLENRVTFITGDVFKLDFSDASIVTMYLLQDLNIELRPRLLSELRPGTRIVSHQFHLGDWLADDTVPINDISARLPAGLVDDDADMLYLWIVPARIDGTWEWSAAGLPWRLKVQQTYQMFEGSLAVARRDSTVQDGRIAGNRVRFETHALLSDREVPIRFDGTVSGNVMHGSMAIGGTAHAVTVRRSH